MKTRLVTHNKDGKAHNTSLAYMLSPGTVGLIPGQPGSGKTRAMAAALAELAVARDGHVLLSVREEVATHLIDTLPEMSRNRVHIWTRHTDTLPELFEAAATAALKAAPLPLVAVGIDDYADLTDDDLADLLLWAEEEEVVLLRSVQLKRSGPGTEAKDYTMRAGDLMGCDFMILPESVSKDGDVLTVSAKMTFR